MENSPFAQSNRVVRSPPGTPASTSASTLQPPTQSTDAPEVVATPEIQKWLTTIDQTLTDICHIVSDGKMNSEQKLRVNALCRRVSNGTSQMAVLYQSLKARALLAHQSACNLENQLDLSLQLKDLQQRIADTPIPAQINSFADMVKKGANNFIQPLKVSSVVIYPNDKTKTSDETKILVQKIIRPEEMKLQVRGLHKTKNGGVIISTESKGDIVKLRQSAQLISSGLTIDEPKKRKPRVVIIGVPSAMSDVDMLTCLYHQNLADKLENCSLDTFLTTTRLSHKSGRRDAETCNYVIEVTAVIRKALISQDRVFINWSSCPVRDFTLVTRCFKCHQYGHAAKSCRQTSFTCGHCGEQDHSIKDCPKKSDEPKCATCVHFKKPHNHMTGATECPAKVMAEKRYINSVDYGDT